MLKEQGWKEGGTAQWKERRIDIEWQDVMLKDG